MECVRPEEHVRAKKLVLDGFLLSPAEQTVAVGTSRGLALYGTGSLELEWFAPTWHGVDDMAWSPDGKRIATTDASGCVFLWDAANGENVQQLCGHSENHVHVEWSTRPDLIATGAGSPDSRQGEVLFWNTELKKPIHILKGVFNSQNDMEWSPDGTMLATWSIHEDKIDLRDAETFEPVRKLQMPENVMNVFWSPDGKMLAVPAPFYNDELIIWNAKTGGRVNVLSGDISSLGDDGVAWSPDSKNIAAVVYIETRSAYEEDKTVMVWDVKSGVKLREFAGHAFSFSPDGGAIAVAVAGGDLMVFDMQSGERRWRLSDVPMRIESVAWSDGNVIIADGGGWITAWNAETGELIRSTDGNGIEE